MNVDNNRAGRAVVGALFSLLVSCADGDSTPAYDYPADPASPQRVSPPVPVTTTTDTTRDPSAPGDDAELGMPASNLGSGGTSSFNLAGAGGTLGGVGGSYEDDYPLPAGLAGEGGLGGVGGYGGYGGSY